MLGACGTGAARGPPGTPNGIMDPYKTDFYQLSFQLGHNRPTFSEKCQDCEKGRDRPLRHGLGPENTRMDMKCYPRRTSKDSSAGTVTSRQRALHRKPKARQRTGGATGNERRR